ncbi:MAG TPA: hypothetical protein VKY15_03625, partial [Acidimicrobiales bacterium]|nr:hypothetical protein [Acidimicrobiales bacterium]
RNRLRSAGGGVPEGNGQLAADPVAGSRPAGGNGPSAQASPAGAPTATATLAPPAVMRAAGGGEGPGPEPEQSPPAPSGDPAATARDGGELGPGRVAGMTLGELASASGLSTEELGELEGFGLIRGERFANDVLYSQAALRVARLAAGFRRYGIGARHLRLYKTAVDREAGMLEQVIVPLIKQRDPEARHQSMRAMEELVGLGRDLRDVLMEEALRGHLQG